MVFFVLLAGAGYAYYQQQTKGDEYPLDPSVNLENKQAIDFLPLELRSGLFSNATTTITFYKGDYREIRERLEGRVQEILQANPWLGGWCVLQKKKLVCGLLVVLLSFVLIHPSTLLLSIQIQAGTKTR